MSSPRVAIAINSFIQLIVHLIILSPSPIQSQPASTIEIRSPSVSNIDIPPSESNRPQSWFHLPPPDQNQPTLTYLTLNLCNAPPSSQIEYHFDSILIVSNSTDNQSPSPSNLPTKQHRTLLSSASITGGYADLKAGFANLTLVNSVGLWIYIQPPRSNHPLPNSDTNPFRYTFQLGISTTSPIHAVNSFPAFKFDDTDDTHALITASDSSLFQPHNSSSPLSLQSFIPVILPTPNDLQFGLSSSLCYLQSLLNSTANTSTQPQPMSSITPSLTSRTTGVGQFSSQPSGNISDHDYRVSDVAAGLRTQYLISNLKPTQNYTAWLFQPSGSVNNILTGRLWPYINFRTKTSQNCRLLYDLPFCPSVAYSVPASTTQSTPSLVSFYNQTISGNMTNFQTVLSTYPCNNDTSGRYSFVSGCGDCLRAYNDWLCAVSMPRCTDSPPPPPSPSSGLTSMMSMMLQSNQIVLSRNEPNQSRTSSLTDSRVYPYGEILPCTSVCALVAATCPPLIGWNCPSTSTTASLLESNSSSLLEISSYSNLESLDGLEVLGGQQTQLGTGGFRSMDRFGNVFCNALDSDMSYSRMGSSISLLLHPSKNLLFSLFFSKSLSLFLPLLLF